jgi:hypothetical protein
MKTIFISHTPEDEHCAEVIHLGLEKAGYHVWSAPDYPTPSEVTYPYIVENGIMGCAAMLLLWSSSTARFEWGRRHLAFAQRLNKPVVPVLLDETELPGTLLANPLVAEQGECSGVVPQVLPRLPAPDGDDPLLTMNELAAHEYIRKRREAIDLAADMVQHGKYRTEALSILEYLAHNDLVNGVRVKAQAVLAAQTEVTNEPISVPPPTQAPTSSRDDEARHTFRVRCKNGHISTFDKRVACAQRTKVARETPRGMRVILDELVLPCPICQVEMAVDIDCEGY